MQNIIDLKNINQSYDGGKTWILKDLNFHIPKKQGKGEFAVILGPSGSGKSTVLRYIAGLQKPTQGSIYIEGKSISNKHRVSMVFQQYSSLPWLSVLDNVALGLKLQGVAQSERNERAMELIKVVGLNGHEKKFAQYPTLSGGQLQRVAIARSILANPKILLMDEPFGALDIKTRIQMQDLLLELWDKYKSSILFITHDISEAVYMAQDIFILKQAPNARFIEQVEVQLPTERTHEVKRTKDYLELVHYVEDKMMALDHLSGE
jgi:NitT/TauT family transport system ATP-binding protein